MSIGGSTKAVGRSAASEPVAIQGAILAFVNLLVAFNLVNATDTQIASINVFLAAILAIFARNLVTPLTNPRDKDGRRLVPESQ